jgi:hypothetical protein
MNDCTTDTKNKNSTNFYRGINEFKERYEPRTNMVKDGKGNVLADYYSILNR